jgi:hypothetical protein
MGASLQSATLPHPPRDEGAQSNKTLLAHYRNNGLRNSYSYAVNYEIDWEPVRIYILTDILSQWNQHWTRRAQNERGSPVKHDSNRPIDLLANLAREYQAKYRKLDEATLNTPPEKLPRQLKVLAEAATDRFRSAQMLVAQRMAEDTRPESNEDFQLLSELFQCFDEMRIIFQILLEHYPQKDSRD